MKWRLIVGGLLLASALSCSRPEGQRAAASAGDSATGGGSLVAAAPVRVSAAGTEATEPAAAAAPDGTVYVAWVEHRGKEADVWLAHLDGEGKPSGVPTRVNPKAGEATAWHGDPPTLAVGRDGAVYVGWTARDNAAPRASTLYVSASRDGGRGFGAPTKVNDDAKPGVHGMHSLALTGDGRVYVAWLDERNVAPKHAHPGKAPSHMHTESNREVFFAASADGGRTFSPNVRVASEVCPCCKTSLAVAGDGRVYVGWRQVLPGDYRHIAVASSADGGHTFSAPTVVSNDGWQLSGCPVSGAALSVGADERLRVLWYTAGEAGKPGIYWSESSDGGRTFLPRRSLAETGGRGTPVLLNGEGGGLTAVWEGTEGASPAAMTARLKPDGGAAATTVLPGGGELPTAAAAAAGRLFVAYIAKDAGGHSIRVARVQEK